MCYNKETLNQMRIYELRDLGREKGVKSPTSLKKNELIDKILEISCGETEPYRTNRGRPAVSASGVKNDGVFKDDNGNLIRKEELIDKILAKIKEELLSIL